MKTTLCICLVIFVVGILASEDDVKKVKDYKRLNQFAEARKRRDVSDNEEWEEFKKKYNKHYEGDEDNIRRGNYFRTKARVEENNRKYEAGEISFKSGINKFADKTPEEFNKNRLGLKPPQS